MQSCSNRDGGKQQRSSDSSAPSLPASPEVVQSWYLIWHGPSWFVSPLLHTHAVPCTSPPLRSLLQSQLILKFLPNLSLIVPPGATGHKQPANL